MQNCDAKMVERSPSRAKGGIVVQARETRVHALISDLERLRGGERPLSERIHQVIEIVQDINSIRLEQEGPYNYIHSQFVRPPPPRRAAKRLAALSVARATGVRGTLLRYRLICL